MAVIGSGVGIVDDSPVSVSIRRTPGFAAGAATTAPSGDQAKEFGTDSTDGEYGMSVGFPSKRVRGSAARLAEHSAATSVGIDQVDRRELGQRCLFGQLVPERRVRESGTVRRGRERGLHGPVIGELPKAAAILVDRVKLDRCPLEGVTGREHDRAVLSWSSVARLVRGAVHGSERDDERDQRDAPAPARPHVDSIGPSGVALKRSS
jgi:hypothetical protein